MLSAKVLRAPNESAREPRWLAAFERGFQVMVRGYDRALKFCLRHRPLVFLVFLASMLVTGLLLVITPKGFFPQEDIGQISVSTEARPDISFEAMSALQRQVEDVFRHSPYVANVASIVGAAPARVLRGIQALCRLLFRTGNTLIPRDYFSKRAAANATN
jgi:HAE1 family hydrophobic/amphiphilic exporter-1